MNRRTERLFERRLLTALGWAMLFGVCAGLNIKPASSLEENIAHRCMRERNGILTAAMVMPRATPPAVRTPAVPERSRVTTAELQGLPQGQKVIVWFTQYDRIRREAQMTPSEKASAIKLWATSYVASDADKAEARAILTSLVHKYEKAGSDLDALPEVPETERLHEGYRQYFKRARGDFSRYLRTLETRSTSAALTEMQNGRQALAELDVRNKRLDRRLRQQYNIAEFES